MFATRYLFVVGEWVIPSRFIKTSENIAKGLEFIFYLHVEKITVAALYIIYICERLK